MSFLAPNARNTQPRYLHLLTVKTHQIGTNLAQLRHVTTIILIAKPNMNARCKGRKIPKKSLRPTQQVSSSTNPRFAPLIQKILQAFCHAFGSRAIHQRGEFIENQHFGRFQGQHTSHVSSSLVAFAPGARVNVEVNIGKFYLMDNVK